MAAGSISDERFDDYCYNSVMDNVNNGTGEYKYKYVEALRLTSSGVGLLSSFTTVAFVLIGHGCAKIVHGFFLFYGTFGALLSASQLMMALSCRPASKREDVRSIYSVADCTSCYFRFALYLLMCWVSLYIVIAMCKKKQAFKGCSVKIAAVFGRAGIPLSCAWGPGVRCPELPIQRNWNGTVQDDVLLLRRRGLRFYSIGGARDLRRSGDRACRQVVPRDLRYGEETRTSCTTKRRSESCRPSSSRC
eukprot:Em0008g932a